MNNKNAGDEANVHVSIDSLTSASILTSVEPALRHNVTVPSLHWNLHENQDSQSMGVCVPPTLRAYHWFLVLSSFLEVDSK